MIEKGKKVKVHYIGTKENGEEFDNSYKRGDTLNFEIGSGQMIKGFESAVMTMMSGEKKNVKLSPEDGYGEKRQEAIMKVPLDNFPEDFNAETGQMIQGTTQGGHPIRATVVSKEDDGIIIDANHPLAGEVLNFEIELLEVE